MNLTVTGLVTALTMFQSVRNGDDVIDLAPASGAAAKWRYKPDARLKRAVRRVLIALSFKPSGKLSRRPRSAERSGNCGPSPHRHQQHHQPLQSAWQWSANGATAAAAGKGHLSTASSLSTASLTSTATLNTQLWDPSARRSSLASIHGYSDATSGTSASTDDEENDVLTPVNLPPIQRRQAIFDGKSLGQRAVTIIEDASFSDENSCEESDTQSNDEGNCGTSAVDNDECQSTRALVSKNRKKVMTSNQHGYCHNDNSDEVVAAGEPRRSPRPRRPPLSKRNTVSDFAPGSKSRPTAPLTSQPSIAEPGSDRKVKNTFSLLKLIDKKSHRSKDLIDVLQRLKQSHFKDNYLSSFKDAHWRDVIDEVNNCMTSSDLSSSSQQQQQQQQQQVLDACDNNGTQSNNERKRRDAVWELFTSECVFLLDHLMTLKHCFMEPLKQVQVEGQLMFAEPHDLFGNLDEVCSVSHTFCHEFISLLLKDTKDGQFGRTEILIKGLKRFCELTRDGEVYHDYCINYTKAMTYLEQLRRNDEFCLFEKWCEQDIRCRRLQLNDLLISPMQHCTKVPLLLNNIRRYTENAEEKQLLTDDLAKLENSLKKLDSKINWLKNYERVQEIQQQIVWKPITETEPRSFIPAYMRQALSKQPCDRLLASPRRQLINEGPVTLIARLAIKKRVESTLKELDTPSMLMHTFKADTQLFPQVSKTSEMFMFLFDDILLLTRVKKWAKKKPLCHSDSAENGQPPPVSKFGSSDGAVYVVYRQPIALDRYTVHDVIPPDSVASTSSEIGSTAVAKCSFVLVHITRFQQIIGVYTLQAPSESAKFTWMRFLMEAQETFRETTQRNDRTGNLQCCRRSVSSADCCCCCCPLAATAAASTAAGNGSLASSSSVSKCHLQQQQQQPQLSTPDSIRGSTSCCQHQTVGPSRQCCSCCAFSRREQQQPTNTVATATIAAAAAASTDKDGVDRVDSTSTASFNSDVNITDV